MKLLSTLTLLAAASLAPAAAPQTAPPYELVVIEPDSGYSLAATGCSDVNDLGLVVGKTWLADAFVHFEWTAQGDFAFPPNMPPGGDRRVNNHGDSVFAGGSTLYPGEADLVLADGTHVPIPEPLGTPSLGGKNDLNDDLTVVAQGVSTGTTSTVFHWTPAGGSQGVLVHAASTLRRVSAHGLAVGNRLFNGTDTQAYVVDLHAGTWVDLHALLPGQGGSEAFDVNDVGEVVGFGPDGTSLSAWVWSASSGFTFLPGLAGGPTMYVRPTAIDNQGRVVGSALTGEGDYHAFLWEPGVGMTDLDALAGGGGTYTLVGALDIGETGVIIGRGFHGTWGPDRGFILNPTGGAQPATFPGAASPTSGGLRRRTAR